MSFFKKKPWEAALRAALFLSIFLPSPLSRAEDRRDFDSPDISPPDKAVLQVSASVAAAGTAAGTLGLRSQSKEIQSLASKIEKLRADNDSLEPRRDELDKKIDALWTKATKEPPITRLTSYPREKAEAEGLTRNGYWVTEFKNAAAEREFKLLSKPLKEERLQIGFELGNRRGKIKATEQALKGEINRAIGLGIFTLVTSGIAAYDIYKLLWPSDSPIAAEHSVPSVVAAKDIAAKTDFKVLEGVLDSGEKPADVLSRKAN